MNKEETTALQLLTGNAHFDEIAVEDLRQLVTHYPYFPAAQLLLCQKMQHEQHPDFEKQVYKTALYFPSEPWLRYLLKQAKETQPDSTHNLENAVETDVEPTKPVAIESYTENSEILDAELKPVAAFLPGETETEESALQVVADAPAENNNTPTQPTVNVLENISSQVEIQAEPEEAPLDEEEMAQQSVPLPIEEANQKIAGLLLEQAEEFHKQITPEQTITIETEPYHTIDYFASQGIRFDAKKEDTGFDKKVHKFTDWLRQMKRINPHPLDLGTEAEDESHIVHIAASSNQTRDVVTESMAEVLVKQDKPGKAIEIYEKLSLLYPHKNAYFAAKIQQLKQ